MDSIAVLRQGRPRRPARPADDRQARRVRHGDDAEDAEHDVRNLVERRPRHTSVVQHRLCVGLKRVNRRSNMTWIFLVEKGKGGFGGGGALDFPEDLVGDNIESNLREHLKL